MKIYNRVIDYKLVNSFDNKFLKNNLILPIKSNGIYFDCYICKESVLDDFKKDSILKTEEISSSQIRFFLSNCEFRLKLNTLASKTLDNKESKANYIEEFLTLLIRDAIKNRASDIHMEAFEKTTVIRYRVDGKLKIFYIFEKLFLKILSSYIKMLSKLDLTQSRVAMDGSFSKSIDDKKYDFRVSTMPTINGESIVIRVLFNVNVKKDIPSLGFSKEVGSYIKEILQLTQGLVLVSGPTGSGKSTTLYTLVQTLNIENKKVITVEDPVEYKIEQVQQIEINEDIGLSFESVLKNILRQDPDVILIGEIRDKLSLSIALQASLTGHLVLASIHANNSLETITRLIDLEVDSYLLASCLKYIISQRLVLKTCRKCNKKGCEECNYTGYKGRTTLSEALKIDKEIASIINKNEFFKLKEYLQKLDFKTMFDDGKQKAQGGVCTLDEVLKVIEE